MANKNRVQVWDLFVRLFHWGLVAMFATAYFSTVGEQWAHNASGYAALALVAARVVWGFVGSRHARFADFVRSPRANWQYAKAALRGSEPRYLGHNPAGGLMILFLLGMVGGIGVTGWMLTLDAFWGSETVEGLHILLVNSTLVAIPVHIAAACYESWKHRENLVWSMVVGTKRESVPADFEHPAKAGEVPTIAGADAVR